MKPALIEYKDPRGQCFFVICDLNLRHFDPKIMGFQASSWKICMPGLVTLAASVFEISCGKKQTNGGESPTPATADGQWWLVKFTGLALHRTRMDTPPVRGTPSRKSSSVVVIAHNDIADIKVRKQSANLIAQQLQQQLIIQQQLLQRRVRRDQVTSLLWIPYHISNLW